MENNKYYWIKVDGIVHKYIPLFRNSEGLWCYDQLTTRIFLSDYKLKLLHGKGCIKRLVDFEKDISEWSDDVQKLEYFTLEGGQCALFGSFCLFYYHTASAWQVNKFESTKVLTFNEKEE